MFSRVLDTSATFARLHDVVLSKLIRKLLQCLGGILLGSLFSPAEKRKGLDTGNFGPGLSMELCMKVHYVIPSRL